MRCFMIPDFLVSLFAKYLANFRLEECSQFACLMLDLCSGL